MDALHLYQRALGVSETAKIIILLPFLQMVLLQLNFYCYYYYYYYIIIIIIISCLKKEPTGFLQHTSIEGDNLLKWSTQSVLNWTDIRKMDLIHAKFIRQVQHHQ